MINSFPSFFLQVFRWAVLSFVLLSPSFQVLAQQNSSTQAGQSYPGNGTAVTESNLDRPESFFAETENRILDFKERVGQFIYTTVNEFGHLGSAFSEEFSRIEGDGFREKWAWIQQRYQTSRVGRIHWLMIFTLLGSGILFLLFFIYGLFTKKKKRKKREQKTAVTPADIRQQLNFDPPPTSTPTTFIQQLKAGQFEDVEKRLQLELAKSPGNEVLLMYLFACRAVRLDVRTYKDLIQQVLPTGLDPNQELCAHIAQMGRVLASSQFPLEQYPDPKQEFRPDKNEISKSIEAVSELGDVQTLLNLVRIYIDKGELSETKHLIVEALVRGDGKQRQRALEFARATNI